jgi:dipeptidyl aminopeptidase/acylaminoacyl peptidase
MLQGTEDVIVPINQSDMMVEKIRANGGKVEYIVFEGEGHGFRKADSIRRAIEAELRFYKEIFNLIPN